MSSANLDDPAMVLAAGADDARVWCHAMADEVMRYLYVLSSARGGMFLALAAILVAATVITLAVARHATSSAGVGERTTNGGRRRGRGSSRKGAPLVGC